MLSFDFAPGEFFPEKVFEQILAPIEEGLDQAIAAKQYWIGLTEYVNEFFIPYLISTKYYSNVERNTLFEASPINNMQSLMDLLKFNFDISARGTSGSLKALNDYAENEIRDAFSAFVNTFFYRGGEDIKTFFKRQARTIKVVTREYPEAIKTVGPEFGFHFERGDDKKIAETDRFILYRINPGDKKTKVDMGGKPIMILPPYVLGANILSFLPGEKRSYTHCYANRGIPTYIRILKDISTTPAVQIMEGEDDARDTKYFSEKIKEIHGKPVTLNGYCQGGFSAVCDILSGELDGLVDALITCVSPIDGTRSRGLADFLSTLPGRYNNLAYGSKTLPGGNVVADGKLMAWIYKLKSIEKESPLVSFYRDLIMMKHTTNGKFSFNKTGLALNYWLKNDRTDIPMGITKMSFASFNTPITNDGNLPVKLFGRELNFQRMKEKNIKWLICYGEKDDLVETPSALAPLDYLDVETSPFPKGHVAIATSWSHPESDYALHTRFGEERRFRGPVRFHLDLK